MKKAATKSTPKAGVKKTSLKDLSAGTRAGGVKGGKIKNSWDIPTSSPTK